AAARPIGDAIDSLDRATQFMLGALVAEDSDPALAGASPHLRVFAAAPGGALLGGTARAAPRALSARDNDQAHPGRVQVARFFADNIAPVAAGLADVVVGGAASLADAQQMWVE